MRLDKLLTHLGVASRSGVRDVLKAGRVRVNGEAVFRGISEHVFLNREGKFVRMRRVMPEFCRAVEERIEKASEP